MDALLGSFTKKYINVFNEKELMCLLDLLNLDDENLYKFNQGLKTSIKISKNKITQLFKQFVYKKN